MGKVCFSDCLFIYINVCVTRAEFMQIRDKFKCLVYPYSVTRLKCKLNDKMLKEKQIDGVPTVNTINNGTIAVKNRS